MQKLTIGLRIVYGVLWVTFGLNFFFNFFQNPPMSQAGMAYTGAIYQTGFMFPWIKIVELVTGLMIASGIMAPLGLVILAPILLNILAIHLFLNPAGIPMAAVLTIIHVLLMFTYLPQYRPLLKLRS